MAPIRCCRVVLSSSPMVLSLALSLCALWCALDAVEYIFERQQLQLYSTLRIMHAAATRHTLGAEMPLRRWRMWRLFGACSCTVLITYIPHARCCALGNACIFRRVRGRIDWWWWCTIYLRTIDQRVERVELLGKTGTVDSANSRRRSILQLLHSSWR